MQMLMRQPPESNDALVCESKTHVLSLTNYEVEEQFLIPGSHG